MKIISCLAAFAFFLLVACNNGKHAAGATPESLEGTWTLNYISGSRIAFDGLYPNKKPEINITLADNRVTGNAGCNSFSGPLKVDGNTINFPDNMAMTKMACPGEGEANFLQALKKVNTYAIPDRHTLTLIMGDIAILRFNRK